MNFYHNLVYTKYLINKGRDTLPGRDKENFPSEVLSMSQQMPYFCCVLLSRRSHLANNILNQCQLKKRCCVWLLLAQHLSEL